MTICETIKNLLPYRSPFLFVDEFERIDEKGVSGFYTYKKDEYFYQGHFPDHPITPGVILIETMAQIGLVGLGMYLTNTHLDPQPLQFAFTNSKIDFNQPVYPDTKVWVHAEKIYFRMNKLKCKTEMRFEDGGLVCNGEMAGVLLNHE